MATGNAGQQEYWFMDDGYNRAKSVIIVRGITEKSPIFAKYIVLIGDGWLFADDEMNGNFIKNTLTR